MTAAEKTQRRAIGWTVVLLTAIAAGGMFISNLYLQFFVVFVPLAVVVHEFAHAFQAKARGHEVTSPALAMLRLKPTVATGLAMVVAAMLWFDLGPAEWHPYLLGGLMLVAAVLVFCVREQLSWRIPLPMGVGMHIRHTRRDWSDVIIGSIAEAALWTIIGIFIAPIWLLCGVLTLVVNLIPLKIGGEANDGLCLVREQRARMRGDVSGATEV